MSYPSYPHGYMYPNEVAVGLTWLPVIVTYMLFISIASGSAILVGLGVLLNSGILRRLTPLLLMISLATGLVFLLGPLADLRRPERAVYIFLYPHVIPSEAYPGVSLIALMAGLMWPLLVILLVALWYLVLRRNMWGSIPARVVALALTLVGLVWSTYFALLLFTTISVLSTYNLAPLLPIESFVESVALASSIALLALVIHHRGVEASLARPLSFIVIAGGLTFIVLRFFGVFRLHVYLTGSPSMQIFMEAFSGLNILTLILSVISVLLAIHVYLRGSVISSTLLALTTLLWVLADRWLFAISLQSISKTMLALVPISLDIALWALESIAMVLIALFVYYVLYNWVIRTPTLKGESGGGGIG